MADELKNIGRVDVESFVPKVSHSYIGSSLAEGIITTVIFTGDKRYTYRKNPVVRGKSRLKMKR